MVKSRKLNKPKSRLKNKKCPIQGCIYQNRTYTSSSLGRHIRTVHGNKYQCPYCFNKYTEKKSHKICLIKEKYFIQIFVNNNNSNADISKLPFDKSFDYNFLSIFEENKTNFLCPKLELGHGHYSKVYYGLTKKSFEEIAIKTPRRSEALLDYKTEAEILKLLDTKNFYPKVYNYLLKKGLNQLELTLMGPTLLDLFNFSQGFDKITILNIFSNLLPKIKYLSDRNIIHHDIKPENITWGIIKLSEIINRDELFFIDYGLSINFNDIQNEESGNEINYRKGTLRYMSINSHKNVKSSALDDVESLLYTCLFLANITLPWKNINCVNFNKNKMIMKSKENFKIYNYCGEQYNFLSKIYFYLE